MAARTIISASTIDDLEEYLSPDDTFQVRVIKQGLCIVTRFFAIVWQGDEQELIDYLEENIFDIYQHFQAFPVSPFERLNGETMKRLNRQPFKTLLAREAKKMRHVLPFSSAIIIAENENELTEIFDTVTARLFDYIKEISFFFSKDLASIYIFERNNILIVRYAGNFTTTVENIVAEFFTANGYNY